MQGQFSDFLKLNLPPYGTVPFEINVNVMICLQENLNKIAEWFNISNNIKRRTASCFGN